jgi:hypothetical protein
MISARPRVDSRKMVSRRQVSVLTPSCVAGSQFGGSDGGSEEDEDVGMDLGWGMAWRGGRPAEWCGGQGTSTGARGV